MDVVAFSVAFLFLLLASVHDLRTREVPDLVSYGLVLFALAYSVVKALLAASWTPFFQGLAGFFLLGGLGLLMFYTGQWGGADTKLLAGLGALLGLGWGSLDALFYLVAALLSGAVYGLLYTFYLAARNWTKFKKGFVTLLRTPLVTRARIGVLVACTLFLTLAFLIPSQRFLFAFLLVACYAFFYAALVVKVVERDVLITRYPVGRLTEGDWIHHDVVVKGKRVCGPKDLGISRAQIARLKRLHVKSVMVKEGVPFVPSFLVGLLLFWLCYAYIASLVVYFF